jgi:hypothetical protein
MRYVGGENSVEFTQIGIASDALIDNEGESCNIHIKAKDF